MINGKNIVMTVQEVCEELRDAGIPATPMRIAKLIERGVFPFGICLNPGARKRSFLIWRVDFEKWLKERLNGGGFE